MSWFLNFEKSLEITLLKAIKDAQSLFLALEHPSCGLNASSPVRPHGFPVIEQVSEVSSLKLVVDARSVYLEGPSSYLVSVVIREVLELKHWVVELFQGSFDKWNSSLFDLRYLDLITNL